MKKEDFFENFNFPYGIWIVQGWVALLYSLITSAQYLVPIIISLIHIFVWWTTQQLIHKETVRFPLTSATFLFANHKLWKKKFRLVDF